MKVLLVDDSAMMRKLIKQSLGGEVEVVEASDGMEALAVIEAHGRSIDLILCNMNMPRVNGLSLLRSLRSSPEFCHIPFVVVTADLSDENVRQARREGASGVVAKPFRLDEIAQLVRMFRLPPPQHAYGSLRGSNVEKAR